MTRTYIVEYNEFTVQISWRDVHGQFVRFMSDIARVYPGIVFNPKTY